MGFFSYKCLGCGHPLLSPRVTMKINRWMANAVAISNFERYRTFDIPHKGLMVAIGEYDGFGRINDQDISLWDASCWHHACWVKAGKPDFTEPSDSAPDQGWFFDDGEHDIEEPVPPEVDACPGCNEHPAICVCAKCGTFL